MLYMAVTGLLGVKIYREVGRVKVEKEEEDGRERIRLDEGITVR